MGRTAAPQSGLLDGIIEMKEQDKEDKIAEMERKKQQEEIANKVAGHCRHLPALMRMSSPWSIAAALLMPWCASICACMAVLFCVLRCRLLLMRRSPLPSRRLRPTLPSSRPSGWQRSTRRKDKMRYRYTNNNLDTHD